jgi:gas vesicle protein
MIMRAFGKFLLGATIGIVVGSTVGMFLAPVSGNQMRERVYDYFTNIRDEVKNAAEGKRLELTQQILAKQNKIA